MASDASVAITKELAYKSLKESTRIIADNLGIVPPDLDIHKRYTVEYRYAEEMKRIAAFMKAIADNPVQDNPVQDIKALVSSGNWTKAQLEALVLGGQDE